jgi:hypothetical protein
LARLSKQLSNDEFQTLTEKFAERIEKDQLLAEVITRLATTAQLN